MNHAMLALIDKYLADLPAERDIVSAKEVRDLLLDIRLTFMVVDGQPETPAPPATPEPRTFTFGPGRNRPLPPYDGGPSSPGFPL